MRLIDADALQKEYQKEHGKRLLLIDVAPTIDAVEVVNRPICHELFTDGRQGVTIWLKNGDIIEYYPNKESEVEE